MTDAPNPRRPLGPRDPGDAWVEGPHGRFWGRFGAAGLLAHDSARGILLQHRVEWSDQGGTWGLPGGARHEHEDAVTGALRESHEEARVPAESLRVRFTHVFDAGYWSYTTVAADVLQPFEAVIGDPESKELRWVPLDEVTALPLHTGFAGAWAALRDHLERPAAVVVDAANVVGSRPNGWWRDRVGAAERLIDSVDAVAHAGLPGSDLDVPALARVWPRFTVVLEGKAKAAAPTASAGAASAGRVDVVLADAEGDDTIVAVTADLTHQAAVTVITADRNLRSRVESLGARTVGPSWFWDLVDRVRSTPVG